MSQFEADTKPILEDGNKPKDKYNRVYWMIFLIGIVCMLPWDMLVTVTGYWHIKLEEDEEKQNSNATNANSSDDDLNEYQKVFLSYLGIASSLPSCFVYTLHSIYGKRFSVHRKAIFSLVGMILIFTCFVILAYIDSSDWVQTFMIVNLVLAVIVNLFRSLFRVTNSSFLGKFPVSYIGSLSNGICMSGLFAVSINIVILGTDADMEMVGFYTFTFALSIAIICLALFPLMEKTDFFQHYVSIGQNDTKDDNKTITMSLIKEVFNNCWGYFLASTILGISTNMIYPSATALVQPVNPTESAWSQHYFVQVCCFLAWNVFNYVGTALSGLLKWPGGTSIRHQLLILGLVTIRTALVPYFMFCNLAPSDRSLPVYINSDIAYTAGVVVFAFSDGYLKNISMMFGPKTMAVQHQDATASFLVTSLGFSFAAGSLLSTPIVNAL